MPNAMAMTGTMDNRVYRVKADACRLHRSRTNSLNEIRKISYPNCRYLFSTLLIFFLLRPMVRIKYPIDASDFSEHAGDHLHQSTLKLDHQDFREFVQIQGGNNF
jgi:hypothetical protein